MATPVTLKDLDDELRGLIDFSRASSPSVRYAAINRGYERAIRAVRIIKKEIFADDVYVTIPPMVIRWPLNDPAFAGKKLLRVVNIIALGINPGTVIQPDTGFGGGGFGGGGFGGLGSFVPSSSTVVLFRYAPVQSTEFVTASLLPAGQAPVVYYDLLLRNDLDNAALLPTLALAPPLTLPVGVLMTVKYDPAPLTVPESVAEPILWGHRDLILAFAAERLLRSVGDADADRWGADALQLRRELIEDLATVSEQNTLGVGTELDWDDA